MSGRIPTEQTPDNVNRVLEILRSTPVRLEALIGPGSGTDPNQALAKGERNPVQVLAHLVYTEANSSDHIIKALLVKEPRLVVVHAERQLGKLLKYDAFSVSELLDFFRLRRTALVRILERLTPAKWSRTADKGLKRMESVYWAARALALHELDHLQDLEAKL